MNNKGFTLVELLAVIIILSILTLIVTITVGTTINNSNKNLSETQIKNIENAAEAYYLKEGMNDLDYSKESTKTCVNVSYLTENGYIDDIGMIEQDKDLSLGSVKITYKSNEYTYEYQESVCSETDFDTYCKLVSGDLETYGSQVSCGTEMFYVIPDHEIAEDNTVSLLAVKNINVTGNGEVKQMDNAGKVGLPFTIPSSLLESGEFVYSENISSIETYMNDYKEYLVGLDNFILTLPSYNQIMFNNSLDVWEKGDYWTGSLSVEIWNSNGDYYSSIYIVDTDWGLYSSHGIDPGYTDNNGIRPVLIVLEEDIVLE